MTKYTGKNIKGRNYSSKKIYSLKNRRNFLEDGKFYYSPKLRGPYIHSFEYVTAHSSGPTKGEDIQIKILY